MARLINSLNFRILLVFLVYFVLLALVHGANQFIYNGFRGVNMRLDGIAKIHPNGLLQLTNTSHQEIGHAFFPLPVLFNTSSFSFSTNFVFAMVPEMPNRGGHGIAFAMSPLMELKGTDTQYLGLFNIKNIGLPSNHLLAIELDTVRSPEFRDIDGNHVGIDINHLISNQSASASYFLENEEKNRRLELTSGKPMQLWIEYDQMDKLLNVTLAPTDTKKPTKPLLSSNIDLSAVFLETMHVGFSASTGSVASNHYILGWSFNASGLAQDLDLSNLPSLPPQRKSRGQLKLVLLPSIIVIVLVLIAIAALSYVTKKRYEEIHEDWEQQYGPQRFSYKDLYKATKGFKDKELLGSGGFGKVYKGVLPSSNDEVAVKKVSHGSKQGMKEFVAEIASTGRLRHRNLARLLGYCRRKGELLLVYDYMPNGSLDQYLFSNEKPNLNWVQRYQIIKGVASALLYLHEEWEQVVLHRDVKASNVLLDSDLNGRLGDFGLSKFYDHGSNLQTTCVVGTVGYLAPELTKTGKPTTSSDVFAFGNFMLEVACGRRPVEPKRPENEVILIDWVLDCWKTEAILRTIDPRLEGNYVVEETELVLKLGLLCAHHSPAARPTMRQVVQYLDGNATLPDFGLVPSSHDASREWRSLTSETNTASYSPSHMDSIISSSR